jgi:hypothetical protein
MSDERSYGRLLPQPSASFSADVVGRERVLDLLNDLTPGQKT